MNGQFHNVWINYLRVLALFAVLIIHVSAPAVSSLYEVDRSSWWVANFYNALCRPSVPIFVMITGSLLLPQKSSMKEFFAKRLNKILYPFIFWSQIYLMYQLSLSIMHGEPVSFHTLVLAEFQQIFIGTSVHLWYIYMLVGLYLTIPILRPWIQNASNKEIGYFLIVWIIALLINCIKPLGQIDLRLTYFSGYIGYLVLGYFITDRLSISKVLVLWCIALSLLGFLVTFLGTFLVKKQSLIPYYDFYDFLSINVILCAGSIFIIFKQMNIGFKTSILSIANTKINSASFGIYLNHMLLLAILFQIGIDYKLFGPFIGIPLTAIICLLLSYITSMTISILPYGKYISGS